MTSVISFVRIHHRRPSDRPRNRDCTRAPMCSKKRSDSSGVSCANVELLPRAVLDFASIASSFCGRYRFRWTARPRTRGRSVCVNVRARLALHVPPHQGRSDGPPRPQPQLFAEYSWRGTPFRRLQPASEIAIPQKARVGQPCAQEGGWISVPPRVVPGRLKAVPDCIMAISSAARMCRVKERKWYGR